ncbi:PTH4 protein, partial [Brachypodius atriceps]|nr:PTH4 protein [Brachypodius atriceps]
MFLPQRSLQTVTFWAVPFFACFTKCQDLENRRALTEHQLMHDKGRAVQGLERLMRLHHALGAVHTASSRDTPVPNARWDVQKSQDPSHFNSNDGDEAASLLKQ